MSHRMFEAIRAGLGFLTTIPVGFSINGLEDLADNMYIYVIIGAFIGFVIGIIGWSLSLFPNVNVFLQSSIIILALYSLTGFIHLDGLVDMGDGLLKHGTMEERRKVIKEPYVGVGGIAFCVLSFLLLFVGIISVRNVLLPALITAEISGKLSMVELASFGKATHKGLGSLFSENSTPITFVIALILAALASFVCLSWKGVVGLLSAAIFASGLLKLADVSFGGISGDVIGSSNEIGRVVALIAISLIK
jgi:adenosylcobinamide-GDP ribazoletransferase